jgi:hypothetical protein
MEHDEGIALLLDEHLLGHGGNPAGAVLGQPDLRLALLDL